MAWEAVGESQGTADARSPPRWLMGVQAAKADKHRMQKAEAERLPVNIAQQLRSFGFH